MLDFQEFPKVKDSLQHPAENDHHQIEIDSEAEISTLVKKFEDRYQEKTTEVQNRIKALEKCQAILKEESRTDPAFYAEVIKINQEKCAILERKRINFETCHTEYKNIIKLQTEVFIQRLVSDDPSAKTLPENQTSENTVTRVGAKRLRTEVEEGIT